MEHRFFEAITIQPHIKKIYSRLGYAHGRTQILSAQQKQLDDYIFAARSMVHLKGAACRLGISEVKDGKVRLEGGIVFITRDLTKYLSGCQELVFIGATAGSGICDYIKKNSDNGDNTAAVVFDAVASEAADAALDWIGDFYNNSIRREHKVLLPRRFSCGYGDFPLSSQKVIFEKLQLDHFHIELTSNFILKPEKTVTAVAGINNL